MNTQRATLLGIVFAVMLGWVFPLILHQSDESRIAVMCMLLITIEVRRDFMSERKP